MVLKIIWASGARCRSYTTGEKQPMQKAPASTYGSNSSRSIKDFSIRKLGEPLPVKVDHTEMD